MLIIMKLDATIILFGLQPPSHFLSLAILKISLGHGTPQSYHSSGCDGFIRENEKIQPPLNPKEEKMLLQVKF